MNVEELKQTILEITEGKGKVFENRNIDNPLSLEKLHEKDISFKDLGDVYGFQKAEEAKNKICNFYENIIPAINQIIEEKKGEYLEQETNQRLIDYFISLQQHIQNVEIFAEKVRQGNSGQADTNLKNERQGLINNIESYDSNIKKDLRMQLMQIKIFKLESILGKDTSIDESINRIKRDVKKAEKIAAEAMKGADNVRDFASRTSSQEAGSSFMQQVVEHSRHAKIWLGCFIGATAAFILSISYIIFYSDIGSMIVKGDEGGFDITKAIFPVIKNILLLTTTGIFMKVCLRKYNLERHLEVTYKNRSTALQQFKLFESAISEKNEEAKNRLRLAIANIIFSDPNTGLISGNQDFSVNPIVNLAEDITKKGNQA